jgi:cytochrome c-type biogenesis protein CcmH
MITFWLLAAALIVLALAFVLPALLRDAPAGRAGSGSNLNALYLDQLADIDRDVVRGALDAGEAEPMRDETRRRLLEDVAGAPAVAAKPVAGVPAALGLATVLPLAAVLLYLLLGTPSALQSPSPASSAAGRSMQEVVTGLATRLQAQPDDPAGWYMLGRAYTALGRYRDAVVAFERAEALATPSADLLADHADALAMAGGRRLSGAPAALIQRALDADPGHVKALALAASAAMEAQDVSAARRHWNRILAVAPPDSPFAQAAAAALERNAPARSATAPAAVRGTVDVAPALKARLRGGEMLFVFARRDNGAAIPLAVLKRPATGLPYSFELDDELSISPEHRLSGAQRVLISARVSRTGSATPRSGDLLATAVATEVGGRPVQLLIDREQP